MSKILKVTIEFDDKILVLEGDQAEKWKRYSDMLAVAASNRVGNQNPFETDPVRWTIINLPFDPKENEYIFVPEQPDLNSKN